MAFDPRVRTGYWAVDASTEPDDMAFIDFLYGTAIWKMGVVVSAIVVSGAIVTLLVVNRIWNKELRRDHNDIAGFLIAVVGVIFAILISSLAVIVITRQDHAQILVVQEAQALEAIYRDTDLVAPAQRDTLRTDVLAYLDAAIDKDWPDMREARWPRAAAQAWNKIWTDVAALPVDNLSQMLTVQSLRGQLDKLLEIRRGRAEIATTGVDRVVWAVVLLGSVSTILFAILFGVRNLVAHTLMTALLAFTIALAMIMIIAIDWPYFGGDSVPPERLMQLRDSLQQRPLSAPVPPTGL